MTRRIRKPAASAPTIIELPKVLDLPSAGALRERLAECRGAPVEVIAAGVDRMGGLAQQILLSAGRSWQAGGRAFTITAPSKGFADSAAALGIDFTPFLEGDPK